jgi:hypothetical protein
VSLSHADHLLLILMRGGWHSTASILREHPMMVHSRASDLRARGLEVEHKTTGKGAAGSWYRLASLDAAETTDGPLLGSRSGATHRASAMPQARRSSAASNHARPLGEGEPRRDPVGDGSEPSPFRPSVTCWPQTVASPSPSGRPDASSRVGSTTAVGRSPSWPAGSTHPHLRGVDAPHGGGVPAGQLTLEDVA